MGLAKEKSQPFGWDFSFGDPWENRTPVFAVRGRCLSRLTNGPFVSNVDIIAWSFLKCNTFFKISLKLFFVTKKDGKIRPSLLLFVSVFVCFKNL